jgi:ArsR family transcriptional regulator
LINKKIKNSMSMQLISSNTLSEILPCFRALSDPIRLNVIKLLQEREMCVCDICDVLQIKQPKLSFHLKALRESGLLNTRQQGRWVYYSINPARFEVVINYLTQYLNCEMSPGEDLCE